MFESSDARRALPCFDEPSFKANFSVTLITPQTHQAVLSNMPCLTAQPEPLSDGWQRSRFATSVRMSTYLLAWCVTDFESSSVAKSNKGTEVRVWTSKNKIGATDIAKKAAINAINAYEDYFGIAYPLPKQDQGQPSQSTLPLSSHFVPPISMYSCSF
jgi:aminopeptidase N